jgi:hypothetical protein
MKFFLGKSSLICRKAVAQWIRLFLGQYSNHKKLFIIVAKSPLHSKSPNRCQSVSGTWSLANPVRKVEFRLLQISKSVRGPTISDFHSQATGPLVALPVSDP